MSGEKPVAKFARLRHAIFTSPDPERLADYYRQVIGLGVIARAKNRIHLANNSAQLSLVIEAGERAWLQRIAFESPPERDLNAIQRGLSQLGLRAEIRRDALPGITSALVFADGQGTEFELVPG